jgi:integrase
MCGSGGHVHTAATEPRPTIARHTPATLLLKQGVHPKIVQEQLGHTTISSTLGTYSHVAPGLQEAAAMTFDTVVNGPVPSA